jgi:protein TonB
MPAPPRATPPRPPAEADPPAGCARHRHAPAPPQHAALGALAVSLAVHGGAARLALRRPGGLQPAVPRHAAGGDPGQRAQSSETPPEAQALAQANLAGGGEADKGRATSPLPAMPQAEMGDAPDEAQARSTSCRTSSSSCWRRSAARWPLLPPPDPRATPAAAGARAGRAPPPAAEAAGRDREAHQRRQRRPKKRYVSPATREVAYALYYDAPPHAGRASAAHATSPWKRGKSSMASW